MSDLTINLESQNESTMESDVYLAEEIQKRLRIGRSTTYQFLEEVYEEQKPFRVVKIGKLIRVQKESFDTWLKGKGDAT